MFPISYFLCLLGYKQKNEVVMSIFKDFHLHIVPHMNVDSSDSITDCKTDVSLDTLEAVDMKVSCDHAAVTSLSAIFVDLCLTCDIVRPTEKL